MVEHPAFNRLVPSSILGRGTNFLHGRKAKITTRRAALWWGLTTVIAAVFFFIALSDAVYEATTPPGWLGVLARKIYSVGAFAIVGYCFSQALRLGSGERSPFVIAGAVALYSAAIEIGQAVVGSHEGLTWNGIDVACGFLGGLIGRLAAGVRFAIRSPDRWVSRSFGSSGAARPTRHLHPGQQPNERQRRPEDDG